MPGQPPIADLLRRVIAGEPITAEEENLLRDIATRHVDLPDSITDSMGTRMARRSEESEGEEELYWGMLMEDHPGIDTCFKIILSTWNPARNSMDFDCDTLEEDYLTAVDFFNGVPYPDKYACGWFKRMPSDTTASGYIYVVVDLDCTSRGSCDDLIPTGDCT